MNTSIFTKFRQTVLFNSLLFTLTISGCGRKSPTSDQECFEKCMLWIDENYSCYYDDLLCLSARNQAEHELCELGEFDCSTPVEEDSMLSNDDGYIRCDGIDIPATYLCDGYSDCSDNSDEKNCEGLFTCEDDGSIPEDWVCDGEVDCAQGEDESALHCFVCDYNDANSEKYKIGKRCDGYTDCDNGWDEEYC